MPRHGNRKQDPNQFEFDWSEVTAPPRQAEQPPERRDAPEPSSIQNRPPPLVQVLPWDFRLTFPEPLEAAIEAGVLHDEDREIENIKSMHEEHARQALATLADLDALTDARRLGIDPTTGRTPRTETQRDKLKQRYAEEPRRLEHAFETLMDVYEEAFGSDACDAFRKAILAWHAGVEVVSERRPFFPPLESSVLAGTFGREEDGTVVNPSAEEIDEITDVVADRLTEEPEPREREETLRLFEDDFGADAGKELVHWLEATERAEENEFIWPSGHPWHYYHKGDNADPDPVDEIPPSETQSASEIAVPKDRARRTAKLKRMLAHAERQLEEDKARYIDLADRGTDALSERDRSLGTSEEVELNWATAIALKYNQIRFGLARVEAIRKLLGQQ